MKKFLLTSVCVASLLPATNAQAAAGDLPSRAEMWSMIQMQQKQIEALQNQVQTQGTVIATTEEKIEKTVEIAKKTQEQVQETVANLEPAAGGQGWWNRTSIGGYGEMHYQGGSVDELDLHRFVVNVNHEFTDKVRFHSELEVEHTLSSATGPGIVEVEQAYVEFDLGDNAAHKVKTGLFLVPVGIVNETHEPTTFFGTERNPIENKIIPTTWREGGAMLSGRLGQSGLSYDIAAHSGFQTPTTGENAYKIRNGRQNLAKAEATDMAYTGRLKWTGYPGVELGITGQYQGDMSQNSGLDGNVDATLLETHADIRRGGWGLRALYARWDVNGTAAKAIGRDKQIGWYVEPSYRFETDYGVLGIFSRYNSWDNNAGISNSVTEFTQTEIGFNYWPVDNVVLKADYSFIDGRAIGSDDSRLNLGMGWSF